MTPGLSSVAAPVLDHNQFPVAGVAVTFPDDEPDPGSIARAVVSTAGLLTRRLGGDGPSSR